MAIVQSFGAAEVVTGSCHILQVEREPKIMVDCGMFQGLIGGRNYEDFGFDPKNIDILLITHAHLDHVGRIPKLVKEGFNGKIITLQSTMDLAEVVLLDSAHLMEEEYKIRFKKAQRRGREDKIKKPLYTIKDVEAVYDLPITYVKYNEEIKLSENIRAVFRNAGHILDSAMIEISYKEDQKNKKIVFSGDLGNHNDLVMPDPVTLEESDTLYIESTYGDRNHRGIKDSEDEFKKVITDTLLNQGNVLIPSFAIERTQEILCILKQMYYAKELPKCKIFIDSPMAIRATKLYDEYHNELSDCCNEYLKKDGSIFEFPYVNYTLKPEESIKINDEKSGCIIIAGSGMCNGGRILHHFKHRLWNEKNSVLFVGYQAKGTIGRKIIDGDRNIRIYHEDIILKAKVYTINGFSAHADQNDLIDWMKSYKKLGKVYLIHGEKDKQKIFKQVIKEKLNKKAHIVKQAEEIWV